MESEEAVKDHHSLTTKYPVRLDANTCGLSLFLPHRTRLKTDIHVEHINFKVDATMTDNRIHRLPQAESCDRCVNGVHYDDNNRLNTQVTQRFTHLD